MKRDHVLVIDDDPDFRELMNIAIADWRLICIEAPDCESALQLIPSARASLKIVLLDYSMPGLEPAQCVACLMQELAGAVPIVLVSASVDISERARSIGLERVLAKPFEMDDLHAVITGTESGDSC